jgi:DNA repair exonuclease SbcCD ATPase subunit
MALPVAGGALEITLNALNALDALKALNASGNTVGIMAHVVAMKERISAQNRV